MGLRGVRVTRVTVLAALALGLALPAVATVGGVGVVRESAVLPAQVPPGCTTVPVSYGSTTGGTISSPGEADCYGFTGASGDRVRVRVAEVGAELFLQHEVVRPDNTVLCGPTTMRELTCMLDASGTHTVVVQDNLGTGIGQYGVHVQRLDDPVGCAPLAYGSSVTATISAVAEMDCYRFEGAAGDQALLDITVSSGIMIQEVEVLRPDGTTVCGPATPIGEFPCPLDATGTHTILVKDNLGAATGTYNLGLSCDNPPCGNGQPTTTTTTPATTTTTGVPPTTTTVPPTTVPPTTVPPTTVPPTTVPPTTSTTTPGTPTTSTTTPGTTTTSVPTTTSTTAGPTTTTTVVSTTTSTTVPGATTTTVPGATTTTSAPGATTTTSTTVPGATTTAPAPTTTSTTAAPVATTTTVAPTPTATTSTTTTVAGGPTASVSPSTLQPGQQATVAGSGFLGDTPVTVTMESDPILLGTTRTNAAGAFSVVVTIPLGVTAGPHTIVVRAGGITVLVPVTVVVPAPVSRAAPLVRTGPGLDGVVWLAAGALVAGGLLVLLAVEERRLPAPATGRRGRRGAPPARRRGWRRPSRPPAGPG
jgi:hypothetical protein